MYVCICLSSCMYVYACHHVCMYMLFIGTKVTSVCMCMPVIMYVCMYMLVSSTRVSNITEHDFVFASCVLYDIHMRMYALSLSPKYDVYIHTYICICFDAPTQILYVYMCVCVCARARVRERERIVISTMIINMTAVRLYSCLCSAYVRVCIPVAHFRYT